MMIIPKAGYSQSSGYLAVLHTLHKNYCMELNVDFTNVLLEVNLKDGVN